MFCKHLELVWNSSSFSKRFFFLCYFTIFFFSIYIYIAFLALCVMSSEIPKQLRTFSFLLSHIKYFASFIVFIVSMCENFDEKKKKTNCRTKINLYWIYCFIFFWIFLYMRVYVRITKQEILFFSVRLVI